MGQEGGDILAGGSSQVQIKADGLVDCVADAFGKLVGLRTLEFLLEQVEVDFGPGNEQKSKKKIVGLAMVAAGDCQRVHAVDGAKDSGKVFAAALTIVQYCCHMSLVDGKQFSE